MKLKIQWGSLDGNHHGTEKPGDKWDQKTRRSTWAIVPLGREFYFKAEGRTLFGRRLWIYRHDGACVRLDIMLKFRRSPFPPGHRYGPQDDGGIGTIML